MYSIVTVINDVNFAIVEVINARVINREANDVDPVPCFVPGLGPSFKLAKPPLLFGIEGGPDMLTVETRQQYRGSGHPHIRVGGSFHLEVP